MKLRGFSRTVWPAVLAVFPIALGPAPLEALSGDAPSAGGWKPTYQDVMLGPEQTLKGRLVTRTGKPVSGATVWLFAGGKLWTTAVTDAQGTFTAPRCVETPVLVAYGGHLWGVRTWQAGTAPPGSRPLAVCVVEETEVRGQQPASALFSDVVIWGLVIGAAIAIPIAVHNSQQENPSGS